MKTFILVKNQCRKRLLQAILKKNVFFRKTFMFLILDNMLNKKREIRIENRGTKISHEN